jgi:hypothetical protein
MHTGFRSVFAALLFYSGLLHVSLPACATVLDGADARRTVDYDVQFGLSREYDSGVQTSVTLHASGLVLEFHRTEDVANSGIWYRVGKLLGMSVTWGGSQHSRAMGSWPTVAISKEGYVILVFSDQSSKNGSDLFYRVGKLDPYGDHNQSITWLTEPMYWDRGFHSSIAINDHGVIVEVHETGHASDGNYRHWIPDEATFEAMGYSWGNIRQLSANELNAIPERAPFPAVAR